jgi:hypothetical protein
METTHNEIFIKATNAWVGYKKCRVEKKGIFKVWVKRGRQGMISRFNPHYIFIEINLLVLEIT